MKKITLFNLIFRNCPGEKFDVPVYIPYGCLCIISALESIGYSVDFRDYQFNSYEDPTEIKNILDFLKDPSELIGISCLSRELPYAVLVCNELKKIYPHIKTILGGAGPSGVAGKLVGEFASIDFIVIGEGDITIIELLKALEDKKDIHNVSGIAFKKDGNVIITPERDRIKDLDNLPFPAYNKINLNLYDTIYLSCTRGCPFHCTFCDQASFWKGKLIKRSLTKIFEELDYLARYKSYFEITFSDNIFCHKKDEFKKFYEEYKGRNYNFKFNMCRRLDDIDDDILHMAQVMNCQTLLYGVESGSRDVLTKIKKNYNVNVKDILVKTANKIEYTVASFIFNFPFETIYDFLNTMNLILELLMTKTKNCMIIHLHYLAPIAGSEILEEYGHRLIYREFANILTTGRNMEDYDNYTLPENKKTLTFPPLLETNSKYSHEIRELVKKYSHIFVSYYIYRSEDMEVKEKFLKYLHRAIKTEIMDYFFIYNEYKLFIGRNKFYIISNPSNIRDNAIYLELNKDTLNRVDSIFEHMEEKKLFISPEFDSYTEEIKCNVITVFKKIINEKIDYILLKPLPEEIYNSIGGNLQNMTSCKDCPSMFIVRDEKVIFCGDIKGRYFTFYSSKEDIYKDFLKRTKFLNCKCLK